MSVASCPLTYEARIHRDCVRAGGVPGRAQRGGERKYGLDERLQCSGERHRMRTEGATLGVAMREAARVRLRPILMTTLCTLFGLLPLALGLGAGSEMQRPLALAVIGGLALSTPITLYVVPTLLVAIRGRGYRLSDTHEGVATTAEMRGTAAK